MCHLVKVAVLSTPASSGSTLIVASSRPAVAGTSWNGGPDSFPAGLQADRTPLASSVLPERGQGGAIRRMVMPGAKLCRVTCECSR